MKARGHVRASAVGPKNRTFVEPLQCVSSLWWHHPGATLGNYRRLVGIEKPSFVLAARSEQFDPATGSAGLGR